MAKLENYNGSIKLIDGLSTFGEDYPLMDAHYVQTKEDGTRLDKEISDMKTGIANADTEISDIKTDIANADKEISDIKTNVANVDKKIDSVKLSKKRAGSIEFATTLAGVYDKNGRLITMDDKCLHTDFISVSGYTRAICTGSIASSYCLLAFFDSDYNFLPDVSVLGLTPNAVLDVSIDIPSNASYCVMSHYAGLTSSQGVLRLTQELTNEEKVMARENIGAIGTTKTTEFSATLAGALHSSGWGYVGKAWHTPFVSVEGYKKVTCYSKIGNEYYQLAFFDSDYALLPDVSVFGVDTYTSLEVDIPETAAHCMMFRYGDDSNDAILRMVAEEIAVRCDMEQTLTEEEKARARGNIGAAADTIALREPIEVKTTETGVLTSKGIVSDLNDGNCWNTGYIPIAGYKKVYCRGRLSSGYYLLAFFDIGRNLLTDVSILGTGPNADNVIEMDIPDSAVYCMMSHYSGTNMKTGILRLSADNFDSFFVNSTLKAKTINALGDSITSESFTSPTWWRIISERTGASFNNHGVSGARIAVSQDKTDSFVEREANLEVEADGVIVMGGTNDNSTTRGSWDSTDTTTFYGALNVLMENLLKRFAGKPIIFCTPIHTADGSQHDKPNPNALLMEKTDSDTLSLQLRAEAIRMKCSQYGIPCLDLYSNSGINGIDEDRVYYRTNDTYHPSEIGMARMANIIQVELEKHFD